VWVGRRRMRGRDQLRSTKMIRRPITSTGIPPWNRSTTKV
jgi:hypothetical protein